MGNILSRLKQVSGKTTSTPSAVDQVAPEVDGAGYPIPPSRRKKKAIMSWHDPIVGDQLKQIAKEQKVSQQQLLREAMNLLFAHYKKDEIA
jgi:hypothetical protein